MPCRDSELPHQTRNFVGTSGNVFERLPAREGRTSTIFDDSKNFACSSLKLGPDAEGNTKRPEVQMRREPQNSSIPVPLPMRSWSIRSFWWKFFCDRLSEIPDFGIASGKCSGRYGVSKLESQLQTEVCSKTADPHLTMHWIKEVEIAKSIDELVTSRSTVGQNDFSDYVQDAMVASALLLDRHVHFRKRVSVEEQRAQKYDRFLRGR